MIKRIISGGQTGADQAGWRAAQRFGIATGGWMPRGFLTEDGPRPEFAAMYGAQEHKSPRYPPRTAANARLCSATLIFDTSPCRSLSDLSVGSQATVRACMKYERPNTIVPVVLGEQHDPKVAFVAVDWIRENSGHILNIAGNRESKSPGIGLWVEAFMCDVFTIMGLYELPPEPTTNDCQ